MEHLTITATCKGDAIMAIGQIIGIAKSYGKPISLYFQEGFYIVVNPDSNVQDLYTIYNLECKLQKKEKY